MVPSPTTGGGRALSVGIANNNDGTFTVYVCWNEI